MKSSTSLEVSEVQVSKSNPTDEELAAVSIVLSLVLQTPTPREADHGPLVGGWKSYWRVIRRPIIVGRDGWRSSYRF